MPSCHLFNKNKNKFECATVCVHSWPIILQSVSFCFLTSALSVNSLFVRIFAVSTYIDNFRHWNSYLFKIKFWNKFSYLELKIVSSQLRPSGDYINFDKSIKKQKTFREKGINIILQIICSWPKFYEACWVHNALYNI